MGGFHQTRGLAILCCIEVNSQYKNVFVIRYDFCHPASIIDQLEILAPLSDMLLHGWSGDHVSLLTTLFHMGRNMLIPVTTSVLCSGSSAALAHMCSQIRLMGWNLFEEDTRALFMWVQDLHFLLKGKTFQMCDIPQVEAHWL